MTTDSTRTFFYVPIANYAKLEREVEKLSKRSQKAGGWAIELTRFGTMVDKDGKLPDRYEVYLEAPDVRLDGYRFIARLDHSQETGNIIRMLPNVDVEELPTQYRDCGPKCDHCNINRVRRDTFVLQKIEDNSFVQLGSSCMADFFKTDPRAIMKLAELVSYAREAAQASEETDFLKQGTFKLADLRFIPLDDYLLYCAAAIRVSGGFKPSRFGPDSTKRVALGAFVNDLRALPFEVDLAPTDADRTTVDAAMSWIEKLTERRDADQTLSQFEHNLLVVGQASVIEHRALGIAAAIVGCYERGLKALEPKAPVVPAKPLNIGDMTGILELFGKAKAQYPKITISFENTGVIVLSRAGPSAAVPGSVTVLSEGGYGNNRRYGRIHTDGRWEPNRYEQQPQGLAEALTAFAADPAGVAAAYGHRSGNCCFCHKKLEDERSVANGYGATCAKNYHLPYPTLRQMETSARALVAA
jgi:hypothetical protein